ncbi:MAG: nickel pincer cofactor biosynthesis protein LarC [Desulfobacteraceae bacterium]|nr:MAG: nickel pincer cofactor biosynthesis protein LarC [Desulfobacteraceae bacterium]
MIDCERPAGERKPSNTMTLAYFDCFSGISGDMTLGALVHLGVPLSRLQSSIAELPLEGFALQAHTVRRNGIEAIRVEVQTAPTQEHRTFAQIKTLIEKSPLPETVKTTSLAIFERLAEAEGKVHGCAKESVHFHEVGGLDAIVDIVGACLGLAHLGVETIIASPLPMGGGFVACAHGLLPVPAPAVVELLKGAPVYGGNLQEELVTPTGAAILAGTGAEFKAMPPLRIRRTGYGAGARERSGPPNLLRILIGDPLTEPDVAPEKLVLVESCIDDMNPEIFSYIMETLFEDGALDVYWVPVQMKKNRPGTLVNVLCAPEHREAVVRRILTETTSLGVRFHDVRRTALVREIVEVASEYGKVQVKKVFGIDGGVRLVPEYEVCRGIARERNLPLHQVYAAILRSLPPHA